MTADGILHRCFHYLVRRILAVKEYKTKVSYYALVQRNHVVETDWVLTLACWHSLQATRFDLRGVLFACCEVDTVSPSGAEGWRAASGRSGGRELIALSCQARQIDRSTGQSA